MTDPDRQPAARTAEGSRADVRQPGLEVRPERRASGPGLIDRMRALFGLSVGSIREDIEDALEDSETAGVFTAHEKVILRNVLGLHEVRVEDIIVPRADIVAVDLGMTLTGVLAVFRSAGHSRLPVHGDTLDDPRGMIHIRDFVEILAGTGGSGPDALALTVAQSTLVRPVLFVPPSMPALDLLVRMQASRTHLALVIDEYGGTDGLVSIEDIVEMIVGDIEDEHDEDELPLIERSADGSYSADGRASLEDVSAALGVDLTTGDDAEEIDTVGGLVTAVAGHLPHRGEVVAAHAGFEFEVLDADPRRIKRVRIRPQVARTAAGPNRRASPVGVRADIEPS